MRTAAIPAPRRPASRVPDAASALRRSASVVLRYGLVAIIAGLIALRPLAPRLSAVGSLGAVAMFATTLSFLASAPGVWVHVDGFVVPNETGAFLVKDLFLLGAALWTASEALEAARVTAPAR